MDIEPLRRWELDDGKITFTLLSNFVLLKQQAGNKKISQANAYTLFCNSPTNGYSPPDMEQQFLKSILDFCEFEDIDDVLLKSAMMITDLFYQSDLLSFDPIVLKYDEGYIGPDQLKLEPFGVLLYNSKNRGIDKTYLSFSRLVLAGPGLAGLTVDTHQEIRQLLLKIMDQQFQNSDELLYSQFNKETLKAEAFRVASQRDTRSAVFSLTNSSLDFTLIKEADGKKVKSQNFLCLEDIKYFDFAYFTILTLGFLKESDFNTIQGLLLKHHSSGNSFQVSFES